MQHQTHTYTRTISASLHAGFTPQGFKSENVLAPTGCKNVHANRGTSKENTTLIVAINAVGEHYTPGLIFYGKRLAAHWAENVPDEWFITCTETSMMNTEVFYNWIKRFCKVLKQGVWSILFLDGHVSHISLRTVEYAEAHWLLFFQLPSHSSHLLQPLDLCGFGMVKRAFTEDLTKWSNEHSYGAEKQDMGGLIFRAVNKGLDKSKVRASFAAAGLHPWDPNRAQCRIDGQSGKGNKYTHSTDELPVILLTAENTAAALGARQVRKLEKDGHSAASIRVSTIIMRKILQPKKRSDVQRKRAGIVTGGWLSAAKLREIGEKEAAAAAATAVKPKKRKAVKQPRSSGSSSSKKPARKQPRKQPTASSSSDSSSSNSSDNSDSDRGNDGAFRAATGASNGSTTPARTRNSGNRAPLRDVTNVV